MVLKMQVDKSTIYESSYIVKCFINSLVQVHVYMHTGYNTCSLNF